MKIKNLILGAGFLLASIAGANAQCSGTQSGSGCFTPTAGGIAGLTRTPTLGVPGTAIGTLSFGNLTTGTIKLQPVTGALGSSVLLLPAATDTLIGKATPDELTNKTLTASVGKGIWTASGTWTLPALTLGGAVSGNGQDISSAGIIGGASFSIGGTGGLGFLAATGQSANPSPPAANNFRLFADATGRFSWKRADGFVRTFDATLTADRVYTLPDASGTVALTAGATIPTIAQGDLLYGSAANTLSALAKDTGTSRFLKNSGTSNNPAWAQPAFTDLSGSVAASQMPALTGDITTSAGAVATTLATVNSNVGTFGSATQASQVTVNGKGLVTAAANVTVTPAVGSITGLGTGVATALGIAVGSAGGPVTFNGAGGTPSAIVLTNGTGLPTTGLTGTLQAAQEPAHTGDVTNSAGSLALTIANNAVTLAKLATQATNTVLGNATSGTAVPTALAVGTCSTAASALIWTTNTGFGCNTSITANAVAVGGITGLGTGVATALAVNTGQVGAFVVVGGVLGSPSSAGTLPAFTLGGTVSGGGNQINNVIIGTSTPLAGFFTTASATTSLTSPLYIGGSGTTGTQLSFQTTTGNGTTDAFVWKRGNNGATVAATLDNTGLGIGTVAADTALTVNANTAASVAPSLTSLLHLVGADSAEAGITMDVYSGAGTLVPRIIPRRANGTQASKTAIVSGDVLVAFSPYGWDGSAYVNPANFQFLATENWSGSARGNAWRVFTTPNTTTTITEAIRVHASGGLSIGTTTDPAVGGLQINAQIFMPNITTTSAAQTGTVCWTTGTGKFTVDTTVGCLASVEEAKDILSSIVPADALRIVARLQPFSFRYKSGWGDSGRYEQFGLGAHQVAAVDERLAGRDPNGALQGVRYQELGAVLVSAIQGLIADNDNIRAELNDIKTRIAR